MTFTTDFLTAMRSAIQAGQAPAIAMKDRLGRPCFVTFDRKRHRVFHPHPQALVLAAEHNLTIAFQHGNVWRPKHVEPTRSSYTCTHE